MDEGAGISKLPEPILQHILSFLSLEQSVRTCVLSKSWRHLGSTRPNFSLGYYGDYEKFMHVLEKSLQVYLDQKLCIEDFSVSIDDPELVSLLEKWIPILIHDIGGVKKISFTCSDRSAYFDLPDVVFESESLQELYLEKWKLSKKNCIGNDNHLKTLNLSNVYITEETFANIMSSCPLIERFSLNDCKGFRTIKMQNHHNLKSFDIYHNDGSIEIYLPSTIGCITSRCCPWSWFHHRNYFPGLTCLYLQFVHMPNEWFNSFSSNFPCLEELQLFNCDGFDELKLSSPSIKNLHIRMDRTTTTRATIDAPSIKNFKYHANISHSISFTTISGSIWDSQIRLSLDQQDASQWFLEISEVVSAFSQSQISLVLSHSDNRNQHTKHLSDISVFCSGSYKPVTVKSLDLQLRGFNYDSFFSGLFRIMRPREIKLVCWYVESVESMCRTLQMGRSEYGVSFWQQDLEQVSLEVHDRNVEKWHPVPGTTNWSEYVKERNYCKVRFRLKWRE